MRDGGYGEGYEKCECFWGRAPAGYVSEALSLLGTGKGRFALDLGCGEGKNSAAMAAAGFHVTAIDKSHAAIANAKAAFGDSAINWMVGDLLALQSHERTYDLVIATGSLHCLASVDEVNAAIGKMQAFTKPGGLNVLYAFDDGPHDLRGHSAGFAPILVSYAHYVRAYRNWEIIRSSSVVQPDVHPHNQIEHYHSITRLLAKYTL